MHVSGCFGPAEDRLNFPNALDLFFKRLRFVIIEGTF